MVKKYKLPIVVVLLGPDGAGKSTVAGLVQDELSDMGYEIKIVHLGVYTEKENETSFFRAVKKIHGMITGVDHGKKRSKSKDERPHKQTLTKFGTGKSMVYFTDMCIRYLHALSGGSDIVITDRFFHDLLFHNQSNLVKFLIKASEFGPVHLFRLSADSELIAKRSEHPTEYIEEMQLTLCELNGHSINVGKSPENCADSIIEILQNRDVI